MGSGGLRLSSVSRAGPLWWRSKAAIAVSWQPPPACRGERRGVPVGLCKNTTKNNSSSSASAPRRAKYRLMGQREGNFPPCDSSVPASLPPWGALPAQACSPLTLARHKCRCSLRAETSRKFLESGQGSGRPEPWSSGSALRYPCEQRPCCNCEKGLFQGHALCPWSRSGCLRPGYLLRAAVQNVALVQ